MTVVAGSIRERRRALGLTIKQLRYAARVSYHSAETPSVAAAVRIAAALRVIETGGSLEAAHAAAMPGKRGPRAKVSRETPAPSWPAHDGVEKLSGQCFRDAVTTDGGGHAPPRPATAVLTQSAIGD